MNSAWMDLSVPSDAVYVFDLISPDPARRAAALSRHAATTAEIGRATARAQEIWHAPGAEPLDASRRASLDQVLAERSAAEARTLPGICSRFLSAAHVGDRHDHIRLSPYAVLFVQWENSFPDDWRRSGPPAPWWLKKQVLRRFARAGVPEGLQADVVELVARAVHREHRCEDRGFAELARAVDGPLLRRRLAAGERSEDPLVRLRSGYVRWAVEHPETAVTVAGWRGWLAQDERG